jgi:fatty acid desaturase
MIRFIRTLIQERQRATLPLRLKRRQIYILPTRAGMVFAFFLLAMLVAAINYTNNLAFLLTFLLGSISILPPSMPTPIWPVWTWSPSVFFPPTAVTTRACSSSSAPVGGSADALRCASAPPRTVFPCLSGQGGSWT